MIIKKDEARQLPVLMVDSSDLFTGKTAIAFGSVTVKLMKAGGSAWTTKTMTSGNWTEIDDGLYMISFTAAELDTLGNFNYIAQAAGAVDYHGFFGVSANLVDDIDTRNITGIPE